MMICAAVLVGDALLRDRHAQLVGVVLRGDEVHQRVGIDLDRVASSTMIASRCSTAAS
ncbi:MAG: hypothetical protein U0168_21795 [Nannocystaceae bacterium]